MGFTWLIQLPILIERVYVLGTGERAQRLVLGLRKNPEIGVEVASWTGKLEGAVTKESVAVHLLDIVERQRVHRVIVAMPDRRGTIPMQELLELRMQGVKIEEAATWLERISGKIEVENLYPSWLVFGDGFRRSTVFRMVRRVISVGNCARRSDPFASAFFRWSCWPSGSIPRARCCTGRGGSAKAARHST